MKDYGLVSVITPCWNCSKYIGETIESVLAQTYQNWEMLITDDCSTDDSREIIKEYCEKDPRVRLFKLEQNYGAGIARNNSIKEAQGNWIAFLDSDDIWKPEKLEKQLSFAVENGYDFVFCQSEVIDTNGKVVGINTRQPMVSFSSTKRINYIGTSGAMYNVDSIGKVYMKSIRRRQDWVLWMELLKITKYAYCVQETLSIVRTNNIESLSGKKWKLPVYHIKVYNKYLGYSKLGAILYFYCVSLPCFAVKKLRYKFEYKKYRDQIAKKK